jgi:hypothetical protein
MLWGADGFPEHYHGDRPVVYGRSAAVIDAGYFAKRIEPKPEDLNAPGVAEICSVSHCISKAPEGWIDRWLHNELGWYNRLADATAVVPAGQSAACRVFAYRIFPVFFRHGSRHDLVLPADVHPDPIPDTFQSLGFDAVNKQPDVGFLFGCSPLSCNVMAAECAANAHCLFNSLEDAVSWAVRFSVEQPEPGDYYVIEVLEQGGAPTAD